MPADRLAAVGGPPRIPPRGNDPERHVGTATTLLCAVPAAAGIDEPAEAHLPGTERTANTRELHVNLSGAAYALLRAAKDADPDRTFGDLVTDALRQARPALAAERHDDHDDDPLAPPRRVRRLRVTESRHRSFSVTHTQAAAIAALADEVGGNISELVERAVLIVYGRQTVRVEP